VRKFAIGGITAGIILIGVFGLTVWPNPVFQNPAYACQLTQGSPQGPYYIAGAPYKERLGIGMDGTSLVITGMILDQNCDPIPGGVIDVWQTDDSGNYHFEDYTLRGKIVSDENGMYILDTILPGKYSAAGSIRPAHIHLKVSAPGQNSHTTQLYFEGDPDFDFFVKDSLVLKLEEKNGIMYSEFDFVILN